jgi:hypothetical protein
MASNQSRLNSGIPAIPTPPELTDGAIRYGNAYLGVSGKEGAATQWGNYLRRIPVALTGLAVAASSHTTSSPGAVLSVQATTATFAGGKVMVASGAAAGGEVKVVYNADGTATLTFNGIDAVTVCAIHQLQVPAEVIAFLDAETDPA